MAAKDPVCGMMVEEAKAAGSAEHGGKRYYFCSKHCLARFGMFSPPMAADTTRAAGEGLRHHQREIDPGVAGCCAGPRVRVACIKPLRAWRGRPIWPDLLQVAARP